MNEKQQQQQSTHRCVITTAETTPIQLSKQQSLFHILRNRLPLYKHLLYIIHNSEIAKWAEAEDHHSPIPIERVPHPLV